jgi:hypothetical protein
LSYQGYEDTFFQGETGWFKQVDLNQLGEGSALVPVKSDLESLGFVILGDFVCSVLTKTVTRIWVNPVHNVQALVMVVANEFRLQIIGIFFDSVCQDGASVTTTATRALKDRQKGNSYRKVIEWTNTYNLYQEHKNHVATIAPLHGQLKPVPGSILEVMRELDQNTLNWDQDA